MDAARQPGECAGGAARAVETTGFSTTRFSSFPAASVRGRTSFLNQETIFFTFGSLSSFIDVSCHLFFA
jgi:hypothetical protein